MFVSFEKSRGITDGEAHLRVVTQPTAKIFEVHEEAEALDCPDMTFTRDDCKGISYPSSDTLVVVVEIAEQPVYRIPIDTTAEVNVIYKSCWDRMDVGRQHLLRATNTIVGFSGDIMRSEGNVTLPVTIRDRKGITTTSPQEFYIIDAPTRYNCILGREFLRDITSIPSSFHQTLLFIGENGKVGRARGCQQMTRTCNMIKVVRNPKHMPRREEEEKKE